MYRWEHHLLKGQYFVQPVTFDWRMVFGLDNGYDPQLGEKSSIMHQQKMLATSCVKYLLILSDISWPIFDTLPIPEKFLVTWWFIPISKWIITLVINGISVGNVH